MSTWDDLRGSPNKCFHGPGISEQGYTSDNQHGGGDYHHYASSVVFQRTADQHRRQHQDREDRCRYAFDEPRHPRLGNDVDMRISGEAAAGVLRLSVDAF